MTQLEAAAKEKKDSDKSRVRSTKSYLSVPALPVPAVTFKSNCFIAWYEAALLVEGPRANRILTY